MSFYHFPVISDKFQDLQNSSFLSVFQNSSFSATYLYLDSTIQLHSQTANYYLKALCEADIPDKLQIMRSRELFLTAYSATRQVRLLLLNWWGHCIGVCGAPGSPRYKLTQIPAHSESGPNSNQQKSVLTILGSNLTSKCGYPLTEQVYVGEVNMTLWLFLFQNCHAESYSLKPWDHGKKKKKLETTQPESKKVWHIISSMDWDAIIKKVARL